MTICSDPRLLLVAMEGERGGEETITIDDLRTKETFYKLCGRKAQDVSLCPTPAFWCDHFLPNLQNIKKWEPQRILQYTDIQ